MGFHGRKEGIEREGKKKKPPLPWSSKSVHQTTLRKYRHIVYMSYSNRHQISLPPSLGLVPPPLSNAFDIRRKPVAAASTSQRQIVYGIFLPSLLMVNVAKTCVSQPMGSLLPIPVFAAVQIGVGIVATTLAMRVLKIDPNTEGGRATKVDCSAFWLADGVRLLVCACVWLAVFDRFPWK